MQRWTKISRVRCCGAVSGYETTDDVFSSEISKTMSKDLDDLMSKLEKHSATSEAELLRQIQMMEIEVPKGEEKRDAAPSPSVPRYRGVNQKTNSPKQPNKGKDEAAS